MSFFLTVDSCSPGSPDSPDTPDSPDPELAHDLYDPTAAEAAGLQTGSCRWEVSRGLR